PWLWKLNQSTPFSSLTRDKDGRTEILKLDEIEKVLSEVRADDIKVIRVGDQCDLTDYMVFATGRSSWHVRNIAQALVYKAGSVIVHALDEKARAYYDLESRWAKEKPPAESSQVYIFSV
uniref:Uncharacterized protein n=1 Tax=Chenopodium quinoa TaxID=63459 RepID=A0A803M6T7_CHEQI